MYDGTDPGGGELLPARVLKVPPQPVGPAGTFEKPLKLSGAITPLTVLRRFQASSTDPTHMIVEAVEPANVDTVVLDGRILKRNGKMVACSPSQIIAGANAARQEVANRIP